MSDKYKIFESNPTLQPVKHLEERALEFLIFLFQVLLGVGTKIALVSMNKKITKKYLIASVIIACFVGYCTDTLCTTFGYDKFRGVAVSVMALISETAVKYILQNGPKIMSILIQSKAGLSDDLITGKDLDNVEKKKEE